MSSANDLIATQQQIATAIETTYTNFKKDGTSRKTSDYIKKKLDLLDSYWYEYELNYQKLAELDVEHSVREYVEKDKERVKERYGNIRAHIQSYQISTEERPQSPLIKPPVFVLNPSDSKQPLTQDNPHASGSKIQTTSSASASKTEEMLRKQSSNFKAFHRTVIGIDLESISEKWEFEDVLKTVQARWTAIDSLHWDLDSQLDGSNVEYETTFSTYERKYQSVKKAINQKMWSVAYKEKTVPVLEIPEFSGSYHSWISFKDLFNETIHSNNAMSNAQKMQYLKSKVKGDAEKIISHLKISSENYQTCWDLLNQRYNNLRLIFTSHMHTLTNLPVLQHQSVNLIKRMHDTTQECLNAIKNLGVDVSSWDPIIVYLLSQKLDTQSYTDYMESVENPRELPNLKEFLQFLEIKFTTLESARRKQDNPAAPKLQSTNKNQSNNNQNQKPNLPNYYKNSFTSSKPTSKSPHTNKSVLAKYKCVLCNSNDHGIYFCNQFLEMTPSNRLKTINKLNLCPNCLFDHQGKACISDKVCRECNKSHNRLLHEAFVQAPASSGHQVTRASAGASGRGGSTADTYGNTGKTIQTSSHVSLQDDVFEVLLPTALVKVQATDGSYHIMRCLLDQGSQASLMSEHAAQLLRLPRKKCRGVIKGIGDKAANSKGFVTIRCSSLINDYTFETDALVMNQLIKNLPGYSFLKPDWSYLSHINLADPEFYKSRPIDILLGADVYSIILMNGICKENSTSLPIAQQTQLGWILSGNTKVFQCNVVINDLEEIRHFWEIEDVSEPSDLSVEDKQCVEFYQSTTIRREDGRYEVRLPLKSEYENKLGQSKNRSLAQFYKLEEKLIKNPSIAKQYSEFINEYKALGHMIPAAASDCKAKLKCYLPHSAVIREDSTTTKLRVVFNASSKTSSGLCLNDVLCRGPNLQQDLQSLIIKWRQYQYAIIGDLERMFQQIWVNQNDQNLQMLLWRDSPNKKVEEYKLATVVYGMKSSPFLAMMTLKKLALDEKNNYKNSSAPSVIEGSFYMDDLIHGSHSVQSGKQLQTDLINLLKSGGFNLRKWKSNCPELLEHVNESVDPQINFDFKSTESTKALGLGWSPDQDSFNFASKLEFSSKPTKRALLSNISKIFDPLGWLSPLTTKLKLLFQEIWKTNLQWDDPVPESIQEEWNKIQQEISVISEFRVPRWLKTRENDKIELYGYSDASTRAYSCVVYCKVKRDGDSSIILVAGKTKLVSVNHKCSLPRLELCGAVLLAKLMSKIKKCLANYDISIYCWVDSMVVLGWLNGEVGKWKPFVENRVRQITASIAASCWRYVASKENPADCASRGLTASQLKEHKLWWEGPTWLISYEAEKDNQKKYITDQEIKNIKQVNVMLVSGNETIKKLLEKCSSLRKIIRILAWVLRFSNKNKKQAVLSIQELRKAKILIIKAIQAEIFLEEINNLQLGKSVSNKSRLYNLNPFVDEEGILRVGGRLRHANLDPEKTHPAIIPNNTRLADLIIDQAHESSYHGGARLTCAYIRRQYWLLGGNNATKKRLRLCVKCRKQDPELQHQLMGDLPLARANPSSRPFFHCGVDFTGHVNVKANKGRGSKSTKGYVAVFVCMASKAIHLELVTDLTTSAFIAALRRMAARRGVPGHLYSDQGRNFIGADRVLKEELKLIQQTFNDELSAEIASMGVEWHFNCASWPSAGGLWEASVKSLKYHLKRVIGEQHLTFEEFTTVLTQLEATLNSRPLCPLTEDPDDLDFLTPSHFLSSGPLLTLYETEKDLRTRWHLTQKIFQDVWRRWRDEYLTQLTARSKWRKSQPNIKIDDIVIIKDDNLPPGKWSLGRVGELHPGKDGHVRVVTLKTKHGFLQRPIVKLSLLPINQENKIGGNQEQENNQDNIQNRVTSQKSIKSNKSVSLTSAVTLLLFLITLPSAFCTYNITSLNYNSLYFDRIKDMHVIRDDWTLVVYYDTEPYQVGYEALDKYIQYLDHLCSDIKSQSYCEGVILQLRHESRELQYYNDLLMNHHNKQPIRKRRGLINGIGNIANTLFGVLDDRFAEKYERDISLIKQNQNHLAALWKNQTSVVEAEFNLLKRTESIVNKNNKLIHRKINALENIANQVNTTLLNISLINDFLATSLITNNLLFSLKNVQQTLLDAITNVYNGKISFHLLTPDQLRHELGIISEQLPKDLSLPVKRSDSLSEIYNLLQVRARVTGNYIIFEIKIPLLDDVLYEISRIIPIPHKISNYSQISVLPVSDIVAVNLRHDAFIKMAEMELRSCLQHANLNLCRVRTPVISIKDDQSFCETLPKSRKCKTVTSLCKNRWTELFDLNTYFFFACEQYHLKLACEEGIDLVQINSSGILRVKQGCSIKSSDSVVYSHRQELSNIMNMSSSVLSPEISPINHLINISIPSETSENENFDIFNHTFQLHDIEQKLKILSWS